MKKRTATHLIDKCNNNDIIENIKNDPFTGKDNWLNRYRHEIMIKFLPILSNQSLLDFGCGNGLFLQYLLQTTPLLSVSGYDPYLDPLESVKQKHPYTDVQSATIFNSIFL